MITAVLIPAASAGALAPQSQVLIECGPPPMTGMLLSEMEGTESYWEGGKGKELSLSTYTRPGLEVRHVPGAGRSIYATRAYAAGDVVLVEDAVTILDPGADKVQRLLTFALSGAATQALTLDMYTPDLDDTDVVAKRHIDDSLARARQAVADYPEELAGHSVEKLAVVNMVWVFNGFKYNAKGVEGSSALFAVASKINHSCRPNLAYQSFGVQAGKASWVAKHGIAPGEELNKSYIDVESGSTGGFWSAAMRRRVLRDSKLFVCGCRACTAYEGGDMKRCLPCPGCHAGFVSYRVVGNTVERTPWMCEACGVRLPDTDVVLFGVEGGDGGGEGGAKRVELGIEDEVVEAEMRVEKLRKRAKAERWSTKKLWNDLIAAHRSLETTFGRCNSTLGARHWTTNKAGYIAAELCVEVIGFVSAAACSRLADCDMLIGLVDSTIPSLFTHIRSIELWLASDPDGIDSGLLLQKLYELAAHNLREMVSARESLSSVHEVGKHYRVKCEMDDALCLGEAQRIEAELKRVCPIPVAAPAAEAA